MIEAAEVVLAEADADALEELEELNLEEPELDEVLVVEFDRVADEVPLVILMLL